MRSRRVPIYTCKLPKRLPSTDKSSDRRKAIRERAKSPEFAFQFGAIYLCVCGLCGMTNDSLSVHRGVHHIFHIPTRRSMNAMRLRFIMIIIMCCWPPPNKSVAINAPIPQRAMAKCWKISRSQRNDNTDEEAFGLREQRSWGACWIWEGGVKYKVPNITWRITIC